MTNYRIYLPRLQQGYNGEGGAKKACDKAKIKAITLKMCS